MGEITIAASEREALRALDSDRLCKLIDQAVNEGRSGELHRLRLTDCGPYVASKLRSFESALADHGKAKAAKKRAETGDRLRRAGSDLEFAVNQMKQRLVLQLQISWISDSLRGVEGISCLSRRGLDRCWLGRRSLRH